MADRGERHPARVAFGQIERVSLPKAGRTGGDTRSAPTVVVDEMATADAFVAALVPGVAVERYGREWRLGQWERRKDTIYGRIGFQRAGEMTEIWDQEANDFRQQRLMTGTTAPFAVDLDTLRLAFQRRPGVIERGSFVGALQGLLNEVADFDQWRVVTDFLPIGWKQWTKRVERVTRLEVRLERPNPNYQGRKRVEHLLEDVEANILRLIYEADPDDLSGLDVDDDFVAEAIDHAAKYGSWRARGEVSGRPETQMVQWDSEHEGVTPEERVEADPTTREARFEAMGRELRRLEAPEENDE